REVELEVLPRGPLQRRRRRLRREHVAHVERGGDAADEHPHPEAERRGDVEEAGAAGLRRQHLLRHLLRRALLPRLRADAEVGPAGEAGEGGGGVLPRGGGLPAARRRGGVRGGPGLRPASPRRRGGRAGLTAGRAGSGSGGHGRWRWWRNRREGGRREGTGGGTALQARRPPRASRRRGGSGGLGGFGVLLCDAEAGAPRAGVGGDLLLGGGDGL